MYKISVETLKGDIDRAFRVLGADKGFSQNVADIIEWKKQGFINDEEYKSLRAYNRSEYAKLPIDM